MPKRISTTAMTMVGLLTLLSGCDRRGRSDAEDGGSNLDRGPFSAAQEESLRRQPCWRKERGGWHLSVAHCLPMSGAEEIHGVFVTAFEERSFIRSESTVPDPDDRRRYATVVDLEPAIVFRFAGTKPRSPLGDAYALTFIGRRTRDPVDVDCQGRASFAYVVDRLLTARYLGSEPRAPRWITPAQVRAQPVLVRKIHDGQWGRLEAAAAARCRPHDQTPSHSSSPGNSSAL